MTSTKKEVLDQDATKNKTDNKVDDSKEVIDPPNDNATTEIEVHNEDNKPRRRERSPIVKSRCTKGVVKWFSVRRGYGFIHICNSAEDIFVHHSAIIRQTRSPITLLENQEVEFNIVKGIKGLEACCVSGPNGYRVGTSVLSFPFRGQHPAYHRRNEGGYYPVQQQMEVANGGKQRGPKPVNNNDGIGQQKKNGSNEKPSKKRNYRVRNNHGHQRPRKNSSNEQQSEKTAADEKGMTTDDEETTEKENIIVKKN